MLMVGTTEGTDGEPLRDEIRNFFYHFISLMFRLNGDQNWVVCEILNFLNHLNQQFLPFVTIDLSQRLELVLKSLSRVNCNGKE